MDITQFNIQCESCNEVVEPEEPENSLKYALGIAAIAALFFGVGIGGTIGIATAGLGIAATLPLGLLGAYFGYKGGHWFAGKRDGVSCPKCGSYFG